jgi:FMN phosphatase YigB (HAD superfamily)
MIKAIILDQDGTLYSKNNHITRVLREKTKSWISTSLQKQEKEVDLLYEELKRKFPHPYQGFISLGLKPQDYHKFVFDTTNPSDYLKIDPFLISLLKKIEIPKFITTLASLDYSKKVCKCLGIEKSLDGIFSAIDFPPDYEKISVYEKIRNLTDLPREEILVIGDNFKLDLLESTKAGYQSLLISEDNCSLNNVRAIRLIHCLTEILDEFGL